MKIQEEKIYRCEHCNKPMFNRGAMSLHERMCKSNPKNLHKCFEYCKYLEKYKEDMENYDGELVGESTHFYCTNENCAFHNLELHSYKFERREIQREIIREKNLVRMPLECEYYEMIGGHDLDLFKK